MKHEKTHWLALLPTTWPDPPAEMSVSTNAEIEECPRRWALGVAEYPDIWGGRGYPPKIHSAALAGSVVHLALELITRQLTRARVTSLENPNATLALRELGGYTRIVEDCVERVLQRYRGNPRVLPLIEHAQQTLRGQVPLLRARVQSMLVRLRLPNGAPPAPVNSAPKTGEKPIRFPFSNGTYPEVELRAESIGWKGKADLLALSNDTCEIIDFKTGAVDEAHKFQVRVYALLWSRDTDLNPNRRRADRLVIAYESGDIEVPAPTDSELDKLESNLTARREAAIRVLSHHPPEARPAPEHCCNCSVRHLCSDYWMPKAQGRLAEVSRDRAFGDAEVTITGRHGPLSWDARVEVSGPLPPGRAALVRSSNDLALRAGHRFRLLDAAITMDGEDGDSSAVITLGLLSEIFALPEHSND